MENIEYLKNIMSIASPLTGAVVEYWITPKIKKLKVQFDKNNKLQEHYFNNKFQDYLNEKYKQYSIINILAFRNQQRILSDIYIPLTLKENRDYNGETFTIDKYQDEFIPEYKKILITDTAGMGKSTMLRKLFLSIIEENKGIPILIELRRLSKSRKIIDEIYDELGLLNQNIDKDFIIELIKRGDFIFFLDGYDEIAKSEKKAVAENLHKFIANADKNSFILTSRPDGSLSSFGNFQEFTINPLNEEEVYQLLQKYDGNQELSKSLIEKLKGKLFRELQEFLTNPLLVSLLYTAYEYKHTIPVKKHVFYRQVYDALFEAHDLSKGDYYQREKFSQLSIDEFHTIMRYIAFICLKLDKIEFTKDELLNIINQANIECDVIQFENSQLLKDLITTVPLFVEEGIYYKWTHKSIYEYFVTQFIYLDTSEKRNDLLSDLIQKNKDGRFNNIIDIYSNVDYKSFREVIVKDVVEKFIKYCEKSYQNFDEIDEKLVTERQEIMFHRKELLIQFKKPKNSKKDSQEIYEDQKKQGFTILRKSLNPDHGYGIRVLYKAADKINKFNYTYIFSGNTFFSSLYLIRYLLYVQNDSLVKRLENSSIKDFKNFELSKRKIIHLNDSHDSEINHDEVAFEYTNNLLKEYYNIDIVFDKKECLNFMNKFKDESKIKEKKSFYDIG